ncbi:MAG: hypothetical protein ACRCYX_07840 [Dermatophilaceae bacterium]
MPTLPSQPEQVSPAGKAEKPNSASTMLGNFDTSSDLLLLFHDNKPDPDDIHSQAAIGTMLRDPRFSGVNYHAVQGTIGKQSGTQLDSSSLFDIAYPNNWSNALGGQDSRDAAVSAVTAKSVGALDAGGEIWIVEAGQSDFSADLVRSIKSQRSDVDTKAVVHIVQHSTWNEQQTTGADLTYVKDNTDYQKIGDGNGGGGASPDLNSSSNSTAKWARAAAMPGTAGAMWKEAKKLTDSLGSSYPNPTISSGGLDFSDTVEALSIFGLNDEVKSSNDDILGFFDQFD